jgi:hypothetical protein
MSASYSDHEKLDLNAHTAGDNKKSVEIKGLQMRSELLSEEII